MAKAEIKLYKTQAGSVEKNLLAFKNGELTELLETHPGFHGHGG
jgi:predicted Fe-Mo cluster-binding NifX family protein